MKELSNLKKIIFTSLFVCLCIVLPMAFHVVPDAGKIFSPMHIPVFLCGLICGYQYGFLCGILGPLLSSLMTGMPPIAILPVMVCELIVYGCISGLSMSFIRTKSLYVDLYASLIIAMILGKVTAGVITALFFAPTGYSIELWLSSYFLICTPAMIIQLTLIPTLVVTLEKANVIPKKYQIV